VKFKEAEEELEKAIALDTTFALAYYQLAYVFVQRGGSFEKRKEPIRKAMRYIDTVPEKERYLIQALNASIQGDSDEARALYLELLELYPNEKRALHVLGDLAFHRADYATALTYLEKAIAIDPAYEWSLSHLIWTYRALEQYDKVLEYAKQYATQITTSEEAYELVGDAYSLQADFDSALQTYQRALELFPKRAWPVECMGVIYLFKNDYEKAKREFEKLIQAPRPLSDQRIGYRGLGWHYAYLGKYPETIKRIDKVIEIDLNWGDKTNLASGYAEKAFWFLVGWNDVENAKSTIEKGLQLKNDAGDLFYWYLFQAYLKLGEYEKALPIAKTQISYFAFQDEVVNAFIHRDKGEYEAAIKGFQKASRRYDLALCYLETGQYEKAIEAVRKMQGTYAVHFARDLGERPEVYPKSFYLLGKIYEKMGDKKNAIESYKKLLNLWKDADEDLPELIDAKARLAKLR